MFGIHIPRLAGWQITNSTQRGAAKCTLVCFIVCVESANCTALLKEYENVANDLITNSVTDRIKKVKLLNDAHQCK